MAGKNIKGITIEIGGDTTKLDKALKDVEKTSKEAKGELKEIDKALEKNPGNIDLWKQKQEVLNKELQASKDKLNTLLEVQTQMNNKLASGEISGEQYRAYQREVENTRAEVEELQRAADSCSPALESLASKGEKLKASGDAISGAGEKLLGVTAAVAGLGTAAVKTTMGFDDSMAKVASISGATGDDLSALRDKAKEMGESTKFSASEAADAMQYMAMAGWKTEDMLDGISGIMDLAAASGEDLATTSDIVTDALTAFGLSAEDSGHFADVLAAASSNANTNVAMMGETFKYVAPVCGTLGYTVDDASLAIGLMANAGIKASDAGTALRKGLLNLTAPAKKAKEEMQSLGFYTQETITEFDQVKIDKQMVAVESATLAATKAQTTYNTAVQKYGESSDQAEQALMALNIANEKLNLSQEKLAALQSGEETTIYGFNQAIQNEDGSMKSLRETVDFLREHLSGLSEAEQASAASAIFGTTAVSGMLAVVNASDEDFEKLAGAIEEADGTAGSMSKTMQDTLGGQLTILKSQLEGIAISFGEILMPTIRKIVSKIQELAEKFKGLSPETQELIVKIALVAAAVGPVLIVVGKVIAAIGTLMTWLPKIKAAMVAINAVMAANPVSLVVLAIGALVAAFVLLWKNCEGFRKFWINLWEKIKATFKVFMTFFQTAMKSFSNKWKTTWNAIKATFTLIFDLVLAYWKTVWTVFKTVVEVFVAAFKAYINTLKAVFLALRDKFYEIIEGLKQKFQNFKETFISIWNSIKQFFSGIADFFRQTAENIKAFFTGIITYITTTFTSAWQNAWNNIKSIFTTIFEALKTFWSNLWNGFKSIIENFVQSFKGIIETIKSVFSSMKDKFSEIIDSLKGLFERFKDKFAEIWEGIKTHFRGVVDFFSDRVNYIKDILSNIIDFVKNVFTGNWSDAWGNIKTIFSDIWNNFKEIAKVPLNAIIGMVNGLIRGVNTMVDKMNELHVEIPDWVPSIGGKRFGINIPHVNEIPALAQGGIVEQGTALVGEAGAELLTVMNGKAIVQPLTGGTSSERNYYEYATSNSTGQNSFTTIINVDKISSDMDIRAIGEQLAYEQSRYLKAVGK